MTLGGNALLSCSFPACPRRASLLGDPVYLALIRRQQRWQRRWLLLLSLLTLALFLLSLALGSSCCCPGSRWDLELRILLELRLPRALLALLAGPPCLRWCRAPGDAAQPGGGTRPARRLERRWPGRHGGDGGGQGARALSAGLGLSLAAFGGALVVTMLLIRLARRARLGHGRLLLFGVAIGILTNAAMTWLMYFADDGALREFMFWMMGSLAYGSQQLAWWWLVLPLTLGWLCWQGRALQQLLLGRPRPASWG